MKADRIVIWGVSTLFLLMAIAASPGEAQQLLGPTPVPPPGVKPEVIPGQYIVELKQGVGRDVFINEHQLAAFFRYSIINGFAARMNQQAADRLAADARVLSVTPDLVIHAFPRAAAGPPGSCQPWPQCKKNGGDNGGGGGGDSGSCPVSSDGMPAQQVPTGASRIGADGTPLTGAGVKVAVIDTGIDPCHPDLNVQGGISFVDTEPDSKDGFGHGTHVAGIIGAKDNEFGVVGVAPEALLYAVKVLNKDGSGSSSAIIAGLDWARENVMQVANLSLGGLDFSLGSNPLCTAVQNAMAAGMTVVVAAGNSAFEALYFTPANCIYSVTVTAFADSDGAPGGLSASLLGEVDETFAETFSNYSNYCWDMNGDGVCTEADAFVVDLMAPGVEIFSTMPTYKVTLNDPAGANKDQNYDTLTGTSMATPHVAGAAALYLEANPGATPTDVRLALTTGGECIDGKTAATSGGLSLVECGAAWTDDPDLAFEPLLDARGL